LSNEPRVASVIRFTPSSSGERVDLFSQLGEDLVKNGYLPPLVQPQLGSARRPLLPNIDARHFWTHVGYPIFNNLGRFMAHIPTVILNAIDNPEQLMEYLPIIGEALERFDLPLRFVVVTRRDRGIQNLLGLPALSAVCRQYVVAEPSSETAPDDLGGVKRFIRPGLSSFVSSAISTDIEDNIMSTLVERSRLGHSRTYLGTAVNFVYASDAKVSTRQQRLEALISEPDGFSPSNRINRGLSNPFDNVDRLFYQILSSHHDSHELVFILGLILITDGCAYPQSLLEDLFGLSIEAFETAYTLLEGFFDSPIAQRKPSRESIGATPQKEPTVGNSLLAVGLVSLPVLTGSTIPLPFHTPSKAPVPMSIREKLNPIFYDFLTNPDRSTKFHLDIPFFHAKLAASGLEYICERILDSPRWVDSIYPPSVSVDHHSQIVIHNLRSLLGHQPLTSQNIHGIIYDLTFSIILPIALIEIVTRYWEVLKATFASPSTQRTTQCRRPYKIG